MIRMPIDHAIGSLIEFFVKSVDIVEHPLFLIDRPDNSEIFSVHLPRGWPPAATPFAC